MKELSAGVMVRGKRFVSKIGSIQEKRKRSRNGGEVAEDEIKIGDA